MRDDTILQLEVPRAGDFDQLTELWEGAVRATHRFLDDAEIANLRPFVREHYLPGANLIGIRDRDRDDDGTWLAFMGVSGDELEALFVHHDAHRRGIGRRLAEHAIHALGVKRVDVNEQNPGAVAFYERMGFTVAGRSERDGQGRPFPILHMRMK